MTQERSSLEVAWVAGFFCGEGTVYAHRRGDRHHTTLVVGNTHLPALERCQAVLGGRIYAFGQKAGLAKKPAFMLKLGDRVQVERAIALLRPHLTPEKAGQIDRAEAKFAANPPHRPRGRTCQPGCQCGRHAKAAQAAQGPPVEPEGADSTPAVVSDALGDSGG